MNIKFTDRFILVSYIFLSHLEQKSQYCIIIRCLSSIFIMFNYKLKIILSLMKSKHQKIRGEYHIDSKQITAKKGKRRDDSFTPNSLSTSHNHHKYQKCDEVIEQNNDKETITIKRFKSVVRCFKKYCKKDVKQTLYSYLKKCQLVQRLYEYLRQRYIILGEAGKIQKIETQFLQSLPQRPKVCQECVQNGVKCNEIQKQSFKYILSKDLEGIEDSLSELLQCQIQFCKLIEVKKNPVRPQLTLKQLDQIIKEQQQTIRQLQQEKKNYEMKKINSKKQKLKLEILINEDQN